MIKFLTTEGKEFERLGQNSHPNRGHGVLEGEQKYSPTLDVGGWSKRRHRLRLKRKMNQVLPLHDNPRPHTSLRTREVITNMEWTVLPQPHYSLCLVASNFHLFGPLKDALRGCRFVDESAPA